MVQAPRFRRESIGRLALLTQVSLILISSACGLVAAAPGVVIPIEVLQALSVDGDFGPVGILFLRTSALLAGGLAALGALLAHRIRRQRAVFETFASWTEKSGWLQPIVSVVMVSLGFGLALAAPSTLHWYREDGPLEWAQVTLLCIAAVAFVVAAIRQPVAAWIRSSFLVVAVVLIAVAGEEISWGQRVFGWSTPSAMAEINVQRETNVHNLKMIVPHFLSLYRVVAWLPICFVMISLVAVAFGARPGFLTPAPHLLIPTAAILLSFHLHVVTGRHLWPELLELFAYQLAALYALDRATFHR